MPASTTSLFTGSPGLPLGAVSLLLYVLWEPALVLGPLAVLLFPDGRLPSARWRWVIRAYLLVGLILFVILELKSAVAIAHHQTRVDNSGQLTVFDQSSGYGGTVFILVAYALLLTVWLGALGRQFLAWRHSYGDRRAQFKWLATGAVICFTGLLVSVLLSSYHGWWHAVGDVAVIGAAALPVSIGIGILKYRLYDIDRIISRTLAYVIVTGLLVGLYAGLVLLATHLLSFRSGRRRRLHAGRGGAVQPAAAAGSAGGGPPVQPRPVRRRSDRGGVRSPAERRRGPRCGPA